MICAYGNVHKLKSNIQCSMASPVTSCCPMFTTGHSFAAPTCIPNLPTIAICVRHQDYKALTLIHCAQCISLSLSKRWQQTPHTYAAKQVAGKGRTLVVVSSSSSWVLSHGVRAVRAPQTGLKPVAKVKGGMWELHAHITISNRDMSCIYISYLYTWILCTSNYSVFFLFVSSTFRLRSLFGIPFFSTLEHLGCVASHRLGPDLRRLRCGRASHLPRKREAWPGQLHTIRGRVMMWDEY